VRFLDSWVWLEYLFSGDRAADAETVIEETDTPDVGGVIAPTTLAEVSYRVRVVDDEETATDAVRAISDYDYIESVPVVDEIAEYAAELRYKYYEPGERELSYADATHLATATVHDGCDVLYSGDPDFEGLDEIATVVL